LIEMAELVVTDLCPKMKIYSVANVLSADEAQQLIEAGEARGFKDSSPSGGGHGRTGREDARTSQFSVLVDQDKLAQLLWDRLKPSVPPDCTHLSASGYLPHEQNRRSWAPVGINPRLRLYKCKRARIRTPILHAHILHDRPHAPMPCMRACTVPFTRP